MTSSWGSLFEEAADYEVSLEEIRETLAAKRADD